MVDNPITPKHGTPPDNLSTLHQRPGNARKPRDLLDQPQPDDPEGTPDGENETVRDQGR